MYNIYNLFLLLNIFFVFVFLDFEIIRNNSGMTGRAEYSSACLVLIDGGGVVE